MTLEGHQALIAPQSERIESEIALIDKNSFEFTSYNVSGLTVTFYQHPLPTNSNDLIDVILDLESGYPEGHLWVHLPNQIDVLSFPAGNKEDCSTHSNCIKYSIRNKQFHATTDIKSGDGLHTSVFGIDELIRGKIK